MFRARTAEKPKLVTDYADTDEYDDTAHSDTT